MTRFIQGECFTTSNQKRRDADINFQGDINMQIVQLGEDGTVQEGLSFGADSQSTLQTASMRVSPSAASCGNTTDRDTIKTVATSDADLVLCEEFGLRLLQFEREHLKRVEGSEREVNVHRRKDEEATHPGLYQHRPFLLALAAAVTVEMAFILDIAIATAIIFVDVFHDPMLEPSLELVRGPVAGPPPELMTPCEMKMDTDGVCDVDDKKPQETFRGCNVDGE